MPAAASRPALELALALPAAGVPAEVPAGQCVAAGTAAAAAAAAAAERVQVAEGPEWAAAEGEQCRLPRGSSAFQAGFVPGTARV